MSPNLADVATKVMGRPAALQNEFEGFSIEKFFYFYFFLVPKSEVMPDLVVSLSFVTTSFKM